MKLSTEFYEVEILYPEIRLRQGDNEKVICESVDAFEETLKSIIEPLKIDKEELLIHSSENGHLELVKCLVSLGADVQAKSNYALCWASFHEHLLLVKYLVSCGADIHAMDDHALRYATQQDHEEIEK